MATLLLIQSAHNFKKISADKQTRENITPAQLRWV